MSRLSSRGKPGGHKGSVNRPVLIAETALRILARDGARGLTHRAIDRELDLPMGSTSHYFRTRLDLLAASCKQQVAMYLSDTAWMLDMAEGKLGIVTPQTFTEQLTDMYISWLSPENKWRMLARSELFLGATREPELDAILAVGTGEFHARLLRLFRLINAKTSERAAELLLCWGAGLLYGYAVMGPRLLSKAELRPLLLHMVLQLQDSNYSDMSRCDESL